MLYEDGSMWNGFEWPDPDDQRTQREALEAEGVPFDQWGKAEQSARVPSAELASMLSAQTELGPPEGSAQPSPDQGSVGSGG